jgi:DNA-binding beta-propeller fold protein YncE
MRRWPIAVVLLTIALTSARAEPVLHEVARIALPHVTGRLDHLSADLSTGRLFVAAFGNRTVEVVDVRTRQVVRSVGGFQEPQGVLAIPQSNLALVTDGGADHAVLLDTQTFARTAALTVPPDSDNVRFDAHTGLVWIGAGAGRDGALLSVDPHTARIVQRIPLRGHPESFQLDPAGASIYVNVPSAGLVEVADRDKGTVVGDWVVPTAGNFPMALDAAAARLLVATRHPARLLLFDTASGKVVANVRTGRDADDVFFDTDTRRAYVSTGDGFVHIYQISDPDRLSLVETVHTRAGARTSLFVPAWRLLFVAVPNQGNATAEIRVYEVATAQARN